MRIYLRTFGTNGAYHATAAPSDDSLKVGIGVRTELLQCMFTCFKQNAGKVTAQNVSIYGCNWKLCECLRLRGYYVVILNVKCTAELRTPGNTINEFLRRSTKLPATVGSGTLCYYLSTSS